MRGDDGCKGKGVWEDLKGQVRGDGECKGRGECWLFQLEKHVDGLN